MPKKNLSVPFQHFGAVPFEELDEILASKGLHSQPYTTVLYRLFGLLDWSETIRIGLHDFLTGWTGVLSEGALTKKLGCTERTVRKALHAMSDPDVGILYREKKGKAFRYRILIFDAIIAKLQASPPRTTKIEFIASEKTDEIIADIKNTTRNNYPSDHPFASAKKPDNQDSKLLKDLNPPGFATSHPGPDLMSETEENPKTGGVLKSTSEEKASQKKNDASLFLSEASVTEPAPVASPPSEPAETRSLKAPVIDTMQSSPGRRASTAQAFAQAKHLEPPPEPSSTIGLDIAPTQQIGDALDQIIDAGLDTQKPSADLLKTPSPSEIEDFYAAMEPSQVVMPWKFQEEGRQLKERFEAMLTEAGIDMPALAFFKKCVAETDNWVADGKVDVKPTRFNFYLNAHTGKQIVQSCINKLGGEKRVTADIQKAKSEITEIKERKELPRQMPQEAQKFLDDILGGTLEERLEK